MNRVSALPDGEYINYIISAFVEQTGFSKESKYYNKRDYVDDIKNNIFGITQKIYNLDYLIPMGGILISTLVIRIYNNCCKVYRMKPEIILGFHNNSDEILTNYEEIQENTIREIINNSLFCNDIKIALKD